MARTGRPKAELTLTVEEREQLQRWAQRRVSAQALAMRSRIVLACAQGRANAAVADELGVSAQMVGKWRARFVEARLDGLSDDPRPGRPPSITAEQVEDVWWPRWSPCRPTPRIGRGRRWRSGPGCPSPASGGSGRPSS